ncbi:recQ-mediated genome instability protein 1-like isoform X1 [Argonauta hians]
MEAVRQFLENKHIQVPVEWLEACIDWLKEEHHSSTLDANQIKNLVYEQWLAADLTELGLQYLPQQAANSSKYFLNGLYCLQVNSILDISTSYYTQQTKLKGTDLTNSLVSAENPKQFTPQVPHCRMLKMEMTDGTTVVHGIEYKSIPSINGNMNPGFKVLIKGKILCRNGILFLARENLSVLGGEVDSLMESNALQVLLPKVMKDVATYAGKNMRKDFESAGFNTKCTEKTVEINEDNLQTKKKRFSDSPYHHDIRFLKDRQSQVTKPCGYEADNSSNMVTNSVDEFEEQWDDLDFVEELEELDYSIPKKSNDKADQKSEVICIDDDWDEEEMEMALLNEEEFKKDIEQQNSNAFSPNIGPPPLPSVSQEIKNSKPKSYQSPSHSVSTPSTSVSTSSKCNNQFVHDLTSTTQKTPGDVLLKREDTPPLSTSNSIDCLMNKWTKLCNESCLESNSYSCLSDVGVHSPPFTYLFLLKSFKLETESIKFKVKGYISTLLSRLTRSNGKWQLKCMLNDGSGTLPVELSDHLLTEFIGFTVEESVKMNVSGATKPELKQRLQKGLQQCQVTIVNLYNIFEIEMNQNYPIPVVTKIHPITTDTLGQLQSRLARLFDKV